MSSNKKPKFIQKPYYPGGKEAFETFLKENLSYPAEALEAKVEGTIQVKLLLDHKGKVLEAKAQNKPGYGLEKEAERLSMLLRFHVEKNRGMRVTFHRTVKIPFKLPVIQTKPNPVPPKNVTSLAYHYNTTPSPKTEKKPASKGAYQITYRI